MQRSRDNACGRDACDGEEHGGGSGQSHDDVDNEGEKTALECWLRAAEMPAAAGHPGRCINSAVRDDGSSHGSDETRDAAGEALVEGICVASGWGDIEAGGGCDEGAGDKDEYGGSGSEGDGGHGAADTSEATRNRAVDGANLIMRLKPWKITQLRIRIWRITS